MEPACEGLQHERGRVRQVESRHYVEFYLNGDRLASGNAATATMNAMVRVVGLAIAIGYAAVIVWLYASQPQTRAEALGGLAATVGAYRIDQQAFDDGRRFFRQDQFAEARMAFERADTAHRDARTQFYIAYSYYREGWGRLYNDDALFKRGLEAVDRAIALAPDHRLVVEDENLKMRSGDELKAELERGLRREASDFNPLRVLDPRK
jgi:tetratricopeptide (TPR) repeat protein